jgi:hypothetical protein
MNRFRLQLGVPETAVINDVNVGHIERLYATTTEPSSLGIAGINFSPVVSPLLAPWLLEIYRKSQSKRFQTLLSI